MSPVLCFIIGWTVVGASKPFKPFVRSHTKGEKRVAIAEQLAQIEDELRQFDGDEDQGGNIVGDGDQQAPIEPVDEAAFVVSGSTRFTEIARNKQCPFGDGSHPQRLFRIEGQSVAGCAEKCGEREDCEFFSVSVVGQYKGVCMGCIAGSVFDTHADFAVYEKAAATAADMAATPDSVDSGSTKYTEIAQNKKCPYGQGNHPDRLFRIEGQSVASCAEKCGEQQDCAFFSIDIAGKYKGVCMGCVAGSVFDSHADFVVYEKALLATSQGTCCAYSGQCVRPEDVWPETVNGEALDAKQVADRCNAEAKLCEELCLGAFHNL